MKKRILIIEDEKGIAETVSYTLSMEGFDAVWTLTGKDGLDKIQREKFHLLILDIGLPDTSGFELFKEIRKISNLPVIFLTARQDEIDKVLGLEIGADDYITKPFSPREVAARVKAVLRRSTTKEEDDILSSSPFFVNQEKLYIEYFGKKLPLSRYEYKILSLLIKRPGWVFPREKIMEIVWDEPEESFDRTVDTHIKTIRAKLKEIKPTIDAIITHRGTGYALSEYLLTNKDDS